MFGWIKRTALWIAGLAALAFAAWIAGRRDQRQESEKEEAKSYIETRKEIDNAEKTIGDDPNVLREWLRERGKQ